MTPRKLLRKLLDEDRFDLDDEIKVCMMSHHDEEAHVSFKITEADGGSIYISPKGVSSNDNNFKVKLPECEVHKDTLERLKLND